MEIVIAADVLIRHIKWLERHKEPWEEVKIHWDITYDYRNMCYFISKCTADIFEKWSTTGKQIYIYYLK